jgi:hypothetical protein
VASGGNGFAFGFDFGRAALTGRADLIFSMRQSGGDAAIKRVKSKVAGRPFSRPGDFLLVLVPAKNSRTRTGT